MFRHERPQRGRLRQFTQVGVELIGGSAGGGALEDVEVIALARDYLAALLPLSAPLPALLINSLGGSTQEYSARLAEYFSRNEGGLSNDSRARLQRGSPLRILDSKDPQDAPIVAAAPPPHLPPADARRHEAVLSGLAALGIEATPTPHLVRGLDYYCHTIFEFVSAEGGGAVLAGGRYDPLPQAMLGGAGAGVGAIGWAAGVERLGLLLSPAAAASASCPPLGLLVAVLIVGEEGEHQQRDFALRLWGACRRALQQLQQGSLQQRRHASLVALRPNPSLQKLLAKANAAGAGAAIIVGSKELAAGGVVLKDMRSGEQQLVPVGKDGEGVQELTAALDKLAMHHN